MMTELQNPAEILEITQALKQHFNIYIIYISL